MNGQEFQRILKKKGIKQKDVAAVLGITQQSVSSLMQSASVKTTTLEKIAKAFGIEVSEFFADTERESLALLKEENERLRQEMKTLREENQKKEATIQRLIDIIEKQAKA